ncbi:hypothetical protein G7Y89_g15344 [Cudoniella acicularis]|uniref:Uncharacterized protein n=1 Tax=Cudoniella acicularis TaxID=354080 RepID=A0A8H4QP33_9HELO|nr:hypothetical protein G7Y89_g15344 [Cudoniella acicularis]
MSQQRIPLFFPYTSKKTSSPTTEPPFLSLPRKLRLKIYQHAGLISENIIHLNNWNPSRRRFKDPRMWESGHDPRYWDPWGSAWLTRSAPLPTNLLPVCKSIHGELLTVLYGSNRFVISRKLSPPRGGLKMLEHLRDTTLRELRFLTIRVNVSSCENFCCGSRGYKCGNSIQPCPSPISHDTPLNHESDTDQLVISQWHRICTQLARSISPGKLALYVICDCADITTAQMVIKPLLSLPALRDCGIRLAMHADEEISDLAKDTELQLRILEFTSLINYTVTCEQKRMDYGVRCRKMGSIAESNNYNNDDVIYVDNRPLLQCFCGYAHSAFTFRCDCKDRIFPSSIFLVSRQFREAAMRVFYGQNKFVVSMEGFIPKIPVSQRLLDGENIEETVNDPPEVSIVPGLADFPHSSIKYLTKLQLKFAWHELEYLQPNSTGWKHWLDTIGLLSRVANLAVLTIELNFNERFYPDIWMKKPTFDLEYEGNMLKTYETFIRPMSVLHGMKRLFVYLNWDTSYECLYDGREEHEAILEEIVMGESYDAWEHGKAFQHPGRLEDYLY